MNRLKSNGVLVGTPLKMMDYIAFIVLAIGCFILFQGFDVFGLISSIFYVACGVLVSMIAAELGMESKRARLCTFAVITMPISFYCQFIFGNSKAIMLFFILLGFYFWLKEDDRLFLPAFAVAFLFGSPAYLIFIILVLLKNKDIRKILLYALLCAVPVIIKTGVLAVTDAEYREALLDFTKLEIDGAVIALGSFNVNLTIVITVLVMVYAYVKKTDSKDELTKWSLYLTGLLLFAMYGFGDWEPQWLIVIAPFFTLSAFLHKDTKIFMALDICLMLFFVLFVVNAFAGTADATLIADGIFGSMFGKERISKVLMKDLLVFKDTAMVLSFFTVLMLIIAVFKHPKDYVDVSEAEVEKETVWFVRGRFLGGIAIFLLPAALSVVMAIKAPYVTLYTPDTYKNIGYMTTGRQNSEVFIATRGQLESVEFCVGTYGKQSNVDITVRIVDATNEALLFEQVINASEYGNYDWVYVDTNKLQLTVGGVYRLDIVCLDTSAYADNCITLYRTKDLSEQTHGYAFIDGKRCDYHLCVKIIEDNLPY